MHQQLLFASSNLHKLEEIRLMLPDSYLLLGLNDISLTEEIPEPYDSFAANATAKTSFVYSRTGLPCFADDSGLEIDALQGRPGVLSARYAGEHKSSEDNLRKVLHELKDMPKRTARFVAVIAYQPNEKESYLFEGKVEGTISFTPTGTAGFGYDPIFIPAGFHQSFAELPAHIKNRISHRAKAMQKFIHFLKSN